jgi:hypothetical protein
MEAKESYTKTCFIFVLSKTIKRKNNTGELIRFSLQSVLHFCDQRELNQEIVLSTADTRILHVLVKKRHGCVKTCPFTDQKYILNKSFQLKHCSSLFRHHSSRDPIGPGFDRRITQHYAYHTTPGTNVHISHHSMQTERQQNNLQIHHSLTSMFWYQYLQ